MTLDLTAMEHQEGGGAQVQVKEQLLAVIRGHPPEYPMVCLPSSTRTLPLGAYQVQGAAGVVLLGASYAHPVPGQPCLAWSSMWATPVQGRLAALEAALVALHLEQVATSLELPQQHGRALPLLWELVAGLGALPPTALWLVLGRALGSQAAMRVGGSFQARRTL
jgi:hypothetical protein